MTAAATLAGAVPDVVPGWHSIPWKKVWHNVRRLQARIVKAIQESRWGKVRALVYLLTHSLGDGARDGSLSLARAGREVYGLWPSIEAAGGLACPSPALVRSRR